MEEFKMSPELEELIERGYKIKVLLEQLEEEKEQIKQKILVHPSMPERMYIGQKCTVKKVHTEKFLVTEDEAKRLGAYEIKEKFIIDNKILKALKATGQDIPSEFSTSLRFTKNEETKHD